MRYGDHLILLAMPVNVQDAPKVAAYLSQVNSQSEEWLLWALAYLITHKHSMVHPSSAVYCLRASGCIRYRVTGKLVKLHISWSDDSEDRYSEYMWVKTTRISSQRRTCKFIEFVVCQQMRGCFLVRPSHGLRMNSAYSVWTCQDNG